MTLTREQLKENLELLRLAQEQVEKDIRSTARFYGGTKHVPKRVALLLRSRSDRLGKQVARATIKLDKCDEPFKVRLTRPKDQGEPT